MGGFSTLNIAMVRFPGPNQTGFGDRYSHIAWVQYRKENLHQLPGWTLRKYIYLGVGDMAQWLRVLATPAEDLG